MGLSPKESVVLVFGQLLKPTISAKGFWGLFIDRLYG